MRYLASKMPASVLGNAKQRISMVRPAMLTLFIPLSKPLIKEGTHDSRSILFNLHAEAPLRVEISYRRHWTQAGTKDAWPRCHATHSETLWQRVWLPQMLIQDDEEQFRKFASEAQPSDCVDATWPATLAEVSVVWDFMFLFYIAFATLAVPRLARSTGRFRKILLTILPPQYPLLPWRSATRCIRCWTWSRVLGLLWFLQAFTNQTVCFGNLRRFCLFLLLYSHRFGLIVVCMCCLFSAFQLGSF